MKVILLVAVVGVVVVLVAKVRAETRRMRLDVTAQLKQSELAGTFSPTAALFRDEGVPLPEGIDAGLSRTVEPIDVPEDGIEPPRPGFFDRLGS